MKKFKGFTLAEVLITLAIIGVVAALTIPSVIINYQKSMYVTQLKKEYNQITNAFRTAMANDGVMQLSDTKLWSSMTGNYSDAATLLTNSEFKNELSKIFNIIQIYDGSKNKITGPGLNLNNYDQSLLYKQLNGTLYSGPGEYSPGRGICLADGACLKFEFYKTPRTASCGNNHQCGSLKEFQTYNNTPTKFWQSAGYMYIDVNGFFKAPNQAGRDWFVFDIGNDGNLYPLGGADSAVASDIKYSGCWNSGGASYDAIVSNTNSCYWKYNNNSRAYASCNPNISPQDYTDLGCAARIIEEGWKMNY